jgi:orotate phosphoribosyltransferase
MTESPRQQLLALLAERSFRLGEFRLSSGGVSDYYIDCRATTLSAEGARLTARVVLDEFFRQQWKPQAVGGMTLGADPIVAAVAMLSAQEMQPRSTRPIHEEYWVVDGFLVRKDEKTHGTGQRIEGFSQPGARVVIVDDVCTTGASTIQAIQAARDAQMQVIGVLCLVEREEAHGRPEVEKAAAPAKFVSIFTAREVREEYLRQQQKKTATHG